MNSDIDHVIPSEFAREILIVMDRELGTHYLSSRDRSLVGQNHRDEQGFISAVGEEVVVEIRFHGDFGGKFRSGFQGWTVEGYWEMETSAIESRVALANKALKESYATFKRAYPIRTFKIPAKKFAEVLVGLGTFFEEKNKALTWMKDKIPSSVRASMEDSDGWNQFDFLEECGGGEGFKQDGVVVIHTRTPLPHFLRLIREFETR